MTLFNNTKWVSLSQFGRILIQLLSLTILTRLIPPADYGLMALGTVVMNFVLIVRDLGTASAIIQRKELDSDILNSVFWLNIIMGLVLFLLVNLLTPFLIVFFSNPKLESVLFLLCFCFPIASAGSAHQALMERNSQFKVLAFIEIFAALSGFCIAIGVALKGGGVYALVYQLIATSFISSILIITFSSWRPSIKFKFQGIKKVFGFSGRLTIFNLVNYFARNADSMIISRSFNASTLGAYSIAYRIMLFPLQSLTFVASRSLYPILSRNQDDIGFIKKVYLKTIFTIAAITLPLMAGLAFLREPFVYVALGSQWGVTAMLLLWLAPTGIIQSILSCSGSVLMATNNAKTLMYLGLFGAFIQILSFLVGSYYSIDVFVFLYFISNVVNAIVVLYFTFSCITLKVLDFLSVVVVPVLSGVLMLLVLKMTSEIEELAVMTPLDYVISQTIIGFVIYFILFVFIVKTLIRLGVVSRNVLPNFLVRIIREVV